LVPPTLGCPTGTLAIRDATAHNLRDVDVDVDIPLEVRAARAATEPRTKGGYQYEDNDM